MEQHHHGLLPTSNYAHSIPGRGECDWEPLEVHLRQVASRAEVFAAAFGAGELGRLAGLWHDLGKYLPEFQARIRGAAVQVDHAGPGAAAVSTDRRNGLPLAFVIAGHHAGLANATAQGDTEQRSLLDRVNRQQAAWKRIAGALPAELWPLPIPSVPIAPLAAWIETFMTSVGDMARGLRPAWPRGLKCLGQPQAVEGFAQATMRRWYETATALRGR